MHMRSDIQEKKQNKEIDQEERKYLIKSDSSNELHKMLHRNSTLPHT